MIKRIKSLFLTASLVLAVFSVCDVSVRAAVGDITVTANPDGWTANLSTAGFTTGATYAFGMGSNNSPSSSTPYFTVVSLGYDATGAATTVTRQVYMTKVVRFPYGTGFLTGVVGTGTFVDGETITQAVSGATGKVVGTQASGTTLIFFVTSGTFNNTGLCTGGTSGATFTSSSTFTLYSLPTNNEELTSTGVTTRVALSDYIFQKDNTGGGNSGTAPTVTIPAGFIVNSGGLAQSSNALSGAAITQSSTIAYPKVVGNWAWPGYQRVTADFTLRAVAFHGVSAMNSGTQVMPGKMNLACLKFTAADTHSHTATTTTTTPVYDSTMSDANPVVEWTGLMSVTTLTALDVLTCNFIAYPVVGDSGSILDTSAGTAQPTPLYGPIFALNDKSNTYGVTVAYVTTTGSDVGANTVYDIASYPGDATAYQFASIGKAAAAIAAYNNANHSRNDAGGGIIYLANGSYDWIGNGGSYGTKPGCWLTVQQAATATVGTPAITANAGVAGAFGKVIKLSGVKISGSSNVYIYNVDNLWLDNTTISSTAVDVFDDPVVALYVTRSALAGFSQGLWPYSGAYNMSPALVRGNNLSGFAAQILTYTAIGNAGTINTATSNTFINYRGGGQTVPNSVNTVVAFNKLLKWQSSSTSAISITDAFANTHGFAIVQNLIENCVDNATPPVSTSENSNSIVNNGIIWNNTLLGGKWNLAYNDTGGTSFSRIFWSLKNNNADDTNIKSDTFTGGSGANGVRVGNWPALYGVGFSGNMFPEISGVGAAGSFVFEWPGIKTFQPGPIGGQPPSDTPSVAGYIGYLNNLAFNGAGTPTAGGGNYLLAAAAPGVALQRELLVPYDGAGLARSAIDAAGFYHFGVSTGTLFLRRR